MPVTYAIAMAAGRDAANRNMRAEGRTEWNEEDYNIAAETSARLFSLEMYDDFRNADAITKMLNAPK